MPSDEHKNILAFIARCDDPDKLRNLCKNAATKGATEVERAACLRLYQLLPSEKPGSFEFDVWKSIYALEHTLSSERQRTTRLQRTRNKISQDGEIATVISLILKDKPSDGFSMLIDRDMADLTFEAVALRHSTLFDEATLQAARSRLNGVR